MMNVKGKTSAKPPSVEELITNPRIYVASWLKLHKVTIDPRGIPESPDGRNQSSVFNSMWLDYQGEKKLLNSQRLGAGQRALRGFNEQDLRKAFDELADKTRIQARDQMIESLKCDQEDLTEVKKFVLASTGTPCPVTEACKAFFCSDF